MANEYKISSDLLANCIKEWKGDIAIEWNETPQYADTPLQEFIIETMCGLFIYDGSPVVALARAYVGLFQPGASENHGRKMVALWPNGDKRNQGPARRLACKPGKAFRRIMPGDCPDSVIERMVDKYRERFSDKNYTVKIGVDREDFAHMYSHDQSPMENPATTSLRKSLANSCMRYNFAEDKGLPAHPCEAYATGDFLAVWAEDESGNIAARCVVRTDCTPWRYAPVYGVSEAAMDCVETFVQSKDARSADNGDWIGARLLSIRSDCDGYVAPYLDVLPQSLSDHGKYLVIDRGGEIDASIYTGILESNGVSCRNCETRIPEEYGMMDQHGNMYCDDCYYDRYSSCEHCHEECEREDSVMVNVRGYRGNMCEETWCEYCADNDATIPEDSSEHYETDCLIQLHDGKFVTEDGDYIICELMDDAYRSHECAECDDGGYRSLEGLRAEDWHEVDGVWQQDAPDDDDAAPVRVVLRGHVPSLTSPVECHKAASTIDAMGECGRGLYGPFRPGDTRAPWPINIMQHDIWGRYYLHHVGGHDDTESFLSSDSYAAMMTRHNSR
jgi:hypothetical protein